MKKLMIAAAIVCAAAVSHAAALAWGMGTIEASPDGAMEVGNIAYWMDATTFEAFSALDADKVGAYCAANKTFESTMTVSRSKGKISATSGNWAYDKDNPQSVSGYMVIFDNADATAAGYYASTGVITKDVPSSGNMLVSLDFATATAGWQATAVPEPTSGLLLLLGVAGLALRRRRA